MKDCGGHRVGRFVPRICKVILCISIVSFLFVMFTSACYQICSSLFSVSFKQKKGTMHKCKFKRYPDIFKLAK